MSQDIALYIHFPFCRRRCSYCSFVSYQGRESDIPEYVKALKKELILRATDQKVCSIYFGGGTPSLLSPEQIHDILHTIHSLFTVDEASEVTLEANPGTVDEPYLADIMKLGINRLSLGVQSLDDGELALLGRIHTASEAGDAVRLARNAGFTNLSLDLIYGLPNQTLASWCKTLDKAIGLNPEHISLYPLTLEADAPMRLAIQRAEVPPIDPDLTADQYELAQDTLAAHGYHHYEISNWARDGYKCKHNLVYWHNLPYLGAGVAAHSYIDGHRLANTTNLDSYLNAFSRNLPPAWELDEEIGPELQLSETVILGLRLSEGVCLEGIRSRFGIDLLKHYSQQVDETAALGLLEYSGQRIRLTRRGRLLGNEVFWRFLPG
ncbi:MAG: radical SAM family heme chaperone HemW [Chloroflexi bacterium]|nr:radical SAM family heme chaperone HemW [Chloroflexota bacterium]